MNAQLLALALLVVHPVTEEPGPVLTEAHVAELAWRSIGPAAMGGRIVDLAVHPTTPRIYYVACATSGLFRTTNNGTSFEPVFEDGGSASVGAVAIARSRPETIWLGTGEANPRNSVSWGDGVYRSLDGGDTWEHKGLEGSLHVGAIAIHPTEPDTVYVAAMGSTWGPSAHRGLYRTRDGGESWQQLLEPGERAGCIDVRIDPGRPEVVYAASYERLRDEFDSNDPAVRTGPGSALWRSLDGGDTWERLAGGLPTIDMGRIGVDLWAADPRVLFAIVETARTGERGAPPRSEDRVSLGIKGRDDEDGGFRVESVTEGESAAQAGIEAGDLLTRIDGAEVAGRQELVAALAPLNPGDRAELVYVREGEELTATLVLLGRLLRGRARSFAGSQGGQVANAQDEQGEDGHETGGVFRSDDRGTTWTRVNSLNPRPFYYSQIRVDPTDAERMYVLGISLHRSVDGGRTFGEVARSVHPDHHAMWIDPRDPAHVLLGNDGGLYETWDDAGSWEHHDVLPIGQFYNVAVDMRTPYRVYGGLQDNGSWGGPSAKRSGGVETSDWVKINGGDGFHCAVDPTDPDLVYSESQNGAILRLDLATGERRRIGPPRGGRDQRFNWNTPFLLSPHNPAIFFYAGNVVYRSIDGGESSRAISDEITRTDQGSATALAQSPFDEELLFVGTDDGALSRTRDGGATWERIEDRLPGLALPLYVSDIEPSPHDADTIYLSLDGHRSNDFEPHLYVSEDRGDSWRPISTGLPRSPVRCVALDPVNPRLVFVGNEHGVQVSIDGGERWTAFESELPTVPVFDLVVHPRDAELVAATHGRGIWIADVSPLQALEPDVLAGGPFLFPVQPVRRWHSPPTGERSGDRGYTGQSGPRGAQIYYWLPEALDEPASLVVRDALGRELRALEGAAEPGLHRASWDLRARGRGRGGPGGGRGGGPGGFGGGGLAEPGDYSVTLELGEDPPVRALRVLPDPLAEEATLRAQR